MKSTCNLKAFSVRFAPILLGMGILLTQTASNFAADGIIPPGVYQPNSAPYGKTYNDWSAEHWKWVYSLPVDHHPLFDTADISTGQSGPVWFLGGTFTTIESEPGMVIGNATRSGTIPLGKALFFPIIDSECATIEGNGTTYKELRNCSKDSVNHTTFVACEIDGEPVKNLDHFRVPSHLFTFGPLPQNNVLQAFGVDAPAGATSSSVSDGYFVMVAPLPAGNHTIHFAGALVFTAEKDGFDFTFALDITYNLTVQ
jgi:hypothetical protein